MNQKQIFSLSYNGNDYPEDYASDYYDLLYDDEADDRGLHYVDTEMDGKTSFWSGLSFYQLFVQCVMPAIQSTNALLGTTLLLCIIFRLLVLAHRRVKNFHSTTTLHILSAVCGVLPIVMFHEGDFYQLLLQIVLFPVSCYIVSTICVLYFRNYSSVVFSAIILLTLFYREFFSYDSKWQKTKSAHMLMSMKAMAVVFDLQSNELRLFPSVSQYAGYMMSAGTIYLGPFLTFKEYNNAITLPFYWSKFKLCRIVGKMITSLFYYVLSICVVDWFFNQNMLRSEKSDSINNIFLSMYKQALEFRTGHYFVAYASAVFAIICGYSNEQGSEILVTRPLTIEWPQSLLHVVVDWNAPMHYWLKKYVFEEILRHGEKYKKYRKIIAVSATYFISCLLHGLERRLSAILLSLAAYTYVEHQMRVKLASRFPDTLSSRTKSVHFYSTKRYLKSSNKSTWSLWGVNIVFTVLNIVHLAYLGSIMDLSVNNFDEESQDYFAPWRRVSYFSHIVVLITYLISIIL